MNGSIGFNFPASNSKYELTIQAVPEAPYFKRITKKNLYRIWGNEFSGRNPYSGTDVFCAASAYVVIDVGQNNQLMIALSTTGRGAAVPTPTSTGANRVGTFHVTSGFTTTADILAASFAGFFFMQEKVAAEKTVLSLTGFTSQPLAATQEVFACPVYFANNAYYAFRQIHPFNSHSADQ